MQIDTDNTIKGIIAQLTSRIYKTVKLRFEMYQYMNHLL